MRWSCWSSTADTALLISATLSSSTPSSPSTTTFTSLRLPACCTSSASSSKPAAPTASATSGSSLLASSLGTVMLPVVFVLKWWSSLSCPDHHPPHVSHCWQDARVTFRSARSVLNRRALLRMAAFTALAIPTASGLAACTSGYDDAPDPLRPLWLRASADAKAAEALAASAPESADLARELATIRSAHAEVLRMEVERLNRPVPENGDPAPGATVDGIDALWTRIAEAREEALRLVDSVPRYRAGLVGAVSAGCAAAQQLGTDGLEPEPALLGKDSIDSLDDDSVTALQSALAAEHAAIWVYGLARAFRGSGYENGITRGERAHINRRDACQRVLSEAGHTPRPTEPAYVL